MKLNRLLQNNEYKKKLKEETLKNQKKDIILNFQFKGKPIPYARERKGRFNSFYNPKEKEMKELRKLLLKSLSKNQKEKLGEILKNPDSLYYVYLKAIYYVPIPKGDSVDLKILKEEQVIKPAIRPDLDNYDKFVIDALHEVVFDDDKRVISINAAKLYSLNPRTELEIKIEIIQ